MYKHKSQESEVYIDPFTANKMCKLYAQQSLHYWSIYNKQKVWIKHLYYYSYTLELEYLIASYLWVGCNFVHVANNHIGPS